METESEPYVRLATLRQLHQVVADLNTARSLADTLQTVADGIVAGLGYELACVNLVRPDGDLVVAAFAGNAAAEALITGRVGSRASWERRLSMGEAWGELRFIPHTEGWVLDRGRRPAVAHRGPRAPLRGRVAPVRTGSSPPCTRPGGGAASCSASSPSTGRATAAGPGAWGREALQMYAFQAAIAISNARLRANMQRALVRLEREQQALRASEESFRQAFEYAPSGMAIAEMGGDQHGRLLRTNDALCRLLGRPASAMRRYSFSDLVHPEDIGTLLRTSAEGGRAELRLGPPRRHVRLGLAAQLRRRGRRRRAPLPAHPRRGHRGAQAPRAAARPPRLARLAHRPAQQRRAARPAQRPAVRAAAVAPRRDAPIEAPGRGVRSTPSTATASTSSAATGFDFDPVGRRRRRLRPPCAHRRARRRDATTGPRGSRCSSATSTASSRSTTGSGTTRATPC